MKLIRKITTGIFAIGCLFTLAACQNNQQRQAANQKKISKTDNTLPTGNYFSEDSQQKTTNEQRSRALANVTSQMNKNYKQIGNVKKGSNTLTLTLNGSQMQEMVQEAKQGNSQAKKFWDQLTTGYKKTSKTLSHQLQDDSLTMKIMGPDNSLIYSVSNGNVTTDKL